MLYMDFISKAKELTIEQHENGMWYLLPEWKYILYANDMAILKFRDFRPDWYTVEDNLKLEVEKRNAGANQTNAVMKWVDDVVNNKVEPAMLEDENDLVANALAFAQLNRQKEQSAEE